MLTSNVLTLGTIFFALFGMFAMLYGLFLSQLKLGDYSHYNFLSKQNSPWFEQKTKVIMLIVDGLRFDYLLEYENIDHNDKLKSLKFHKLNHAIYQDPEKFVV